MFLFAIEILFYLVLVAGVVAQLKGYYKWHDRLQIPIVLLNIGFIAFVMVPTFSFIATEGIANIPLVVLLHAAFGTVAQLLAIYCLLAGVKILPRKIGVLRYWMWATFIAWTLTVIFGMVMFLATLSDSSGSDEQTISEHDADEPIISEHDANVEPVTAIPTTPLPDEHAGEPLPVETEELLVPTSESSGPMIDDTEGEMEAMIDEYTESVDQIIEPEYTGQMAAANWQPLEPTNSGPGPRYEHTLQYNAATNQLFLFGGHDGEQIFNDVWTFDLDSLTWQRLAADSPTAPMARYSTVMIVDEAGENLYIATGHTQGGQNLNDIWQLDLATETWIELTPENTPEPRYGGPGGRLNNNLIVTHGFGTTRYDDTWQFNTTTGEWENITPDGIVPLKRCLFAAATGQNRLVIHGGCAAPFGDCFLDDTWILNLENNSWQELLTEAKPVGRQHQTLIMTNNERLILFGGQDVTRAARDDLWYLDLTTGVWQLAETQAGPTPRYNHAAAWMSERGMIVHGGRNQESLFDDLWLLEATSEATATPPPTATPSPLPPTATPTSTPLPPTSTPTPEAPSGYDGY